MNKTNDISLLPANKSHLYDSDAKVGTITFTKADKVLLSQLVGTKVWDVLKLAYAKQRLVQIAVAGISVSQTEGDMWFYKGKSAEADHMIKVIENTVAEFNKEQEPKK